MSHLGDFIDLNDTIRNHKPELYLSKVNRTADPSRSTYVPADVKGKTKLIYTVKEGDNLGYIAEWYRVGLSDLRYWNNIYRNTIRGGQKLAIYVEPSKADYYSQVTTMTFAQKQASFDAASRANRLRLASARSAAVLSVAMYPGAMPLTAITGEVSVRP